MLQPHPVTPNHGAAGLVAPLPTAPETVPTAGATPLAGRAIRFGFQVGGYHLLIAPQTFSEVVPQAVVYPLPNVPSWFVGLLHQRGHLLPVFDLHEVLHPRTRRRDTSSVLVLDQGSDAIGMLVDSLPQAVALTPRQRPLPPVLPILATHIVAVYGVAGKTWLDFDHRGFFTTLSAQINATHSAV